MCIHKVKEYEKKISFSRDLFIWKNDDLTSYAVMQ